MEFCKALALTVWLMSEHTHTQKTYELKNYEFNKNNIPSFMQTGLYRVHILLKKDGIVQSGLEALVDLL